MNCKIEYFGIIAFVVIIGLSAFTACRTVEVYTDHDDPTEIAAQYRWNLASIYETEAHWEADATLLEDELIPHIANYRGTLNNRENTLACLKAYTEASMVLQNVGNAVTNAEKIVYILWLLHLYSEMFFTQIRYAEFEKQIHETGEVGNILNAETLNNIWTDLDNQQPRRKQRGMLFL